MTPDQLQNLGRSFIQMFPLKTQFLSFTSIWMRTVKFLKYSVLIIFLQTQKAGKKCLRLCRKYNSHFPLCYFLENVQERHISESFFRLNLLFQFYQFLIAIKWLGYNHKIKNDSRFHLFIDELLQRIDYSVFSTYIHYTVNNQTLRAI